VGPRILFIRGFFRGLLLVLFASAEACGAAFPPYSSGKLPSLSKYTTDYYEKYIKLCGFP